MLLLSQEVPQGPGAPGLHDMMTFTDRNVAPADEWPYGIEWLNDAYPTPYWVRVAQQKLSQKSEESGGAALLVGSR